jgi:dipeptidyl-peptidase-3
MKKVLSIIGFAFLLVFSSVFAGDKDGKDHFKYQTEQFSDIRILRYQVPGFDQLSLSQKELLYYLYEAALAGRDIMYDQNFKYNLTIRKTIEAIISSSKSDKTTTEFQKFMVYAKKVWFSNGIHHHYSSDKMFPECNQAYFESLIKTSSISLLPVRAGESVDAFAKRILPVIYDPKIAPKKVSLDPAIDLVTNSAVIFHEGVTQKEVL